MDLLGSDHLPTLPTLVRHNRPNGETTIETGDFEKAKAFPTALGLALSRWR